MNKEELKQNVKTFDTPVKKDWDNLIDYVDEKTSETGNFLPLTEFVEPDSTFVAVGVNSNGFLAKAPEGSDEVSELPYKVYLANLAINGNTIITTIFENTLGFDIEWVYLGTTNPIIKTNNTFTLNKTWMSISGVAKKVVNLYYVGGGPDLGRLYLFSYDYENTSYSSLEGTVSIEIRIYP